jgi:glucokinase
MKGSFLSKVKPTSDVRRCALGLDIGGTKMAGCLLSAEGEVLVSRRAATLPKREDEAVVADALEIVRSLAQEARELNLNPVALGLSVCELVDRQGNIVSEYTLRWRDPLVLEPFRRIFPVVVEADSRSAALAESCCGAGQGFPSFLYVTIGTGISCSLVLEGQPYRGAHGCTGTMATGPLSTVCSVCGNMSHSVLEQLSSGSAIGKRYTELIAQQVDLGFDISSHGKVSDAASRDSFSLTAEDALQAAEMQVESARQIIEQAGECVGSAISLLVDVLDPHAVVVGGGLGNSKGLYWETLVRTAREQIWSDIHRGLPILQAKLGDNAAAIGAAQLAMQHIVEI